MTDEDYMRRAIALAETHVGLTGANPSVGCLIVRDAQIVGRGVTGPSGSPHGEEVALAEAGDRALGATAFVTLEPCAQRSAGGASCTDRLIASGVSRVVVASADPSVFAAGQCAQRLRDAGIDTHQGLIHE
eukprot:gene26375-47676_t